MIVITVSLFRVDRTTASVAPVNRYSNHYQPLVRFRIVVDAGRHEMLDVLLGDVLDGDVLTVAA